MKYVLKYEVDKNNFLYDLLKKKGVEDPSKYINITKDSQNDPRKLKNIVNGCELLINHLNKHHKIYIQPD